MSKITFIFPGQGAQKAGIGQSLYTSSEEAKQVFDRADSILGRSLSSLCFEGSEEELQKTENAQVALFTTSMAALAVLKKNRPEIVPEFPDVPVECKVKLLLEVPKYNLQSLVTPSNGM